MKTTIVDDKFTAGLFPTRKSDSHKGTYGTLVIVGGSEKYVGAPYLAALGASALRTGCGIVKIAAPEFLMPALRSRVTECTLFPLDAENGHIRPDGKLAAATDGASAVICGMGIGDTPATAETVRFLLDTLKCPLLLDADALNALSKDLSVLDGHRQSVVITPHIGEMSRLIKKDTAFVKENKQSAAEKFAAEYNAVVLLKDNESVITDGSETLINRAGTPAMAKGGSGDLLAGIIGGMLARGVPALYSAAAGAYIAGKAAEKAVKNSNEYSLLPSETAAYVADAVTEIINKNKKEA